MCALRALMRQGGEVDATEEGMVAAEKEEVTVAVMEAEEKGH